MKKTLSFAAILLMLTSAFTCGKENPDRNDIEFNFYLLNEHGEPSTVFNEGENFIFYFKVTNKGNEMLYFDYNFPYSVDRSFCRVYNYEGQDYGKPFRITGTNYISFDVYQFHSNQDFIFQVPWEDERTDWSWYSTNLTTTDQNYLPKGKYYTEFEYDFVFRHTLNENDNSLKIDKAKFKINFEIK
jgi:hypothetical protein